MATFVPGLAVDTPVHKLNNFPLCTYETSTILRSSKIYDALPLHSTVILSKLVKLSYINN